MLSDTGDKDGVVGCEADRSGCVHGPEIFLNFSIYRMGIFLTAAGSFSEMSCPPISL